MVHKTQQDTAAGFFWTPPPIISPPPHSSHTVLWMEWAHSRLRAFAFAGPLAGTPLPLLSAVVTLSLPSDVCLSVRLSLTTAPPFSGAPILSPRLLPAPAPTELSTVWYSTDLSSASLPFNGSSLGALSFVLKAVSPALRKALAV